MYYLYVLESVDRGRKYIGIAHDIHVRLGQHNRGEVRSTKAYTPWRLVYFEAHQDKTAARKREIELKRNAWKRNELYARVKISGPIV